MNKKVALTDLAGLFEAAAAARDWETLQYLEQLIAKELTTLLTRDRLEQGERSALERMWHTHQEVRNACNRELQKVGASMEAMRDNKDGWFAYAFSTDMEER